MTSAGAEVDLLLELPGKTQPWAIESQLRSQGPEEDGSKALYARAPSLLINPPTSLKVLILRAYGQPFFKPSSVLL